MEKTGISYSHDFEHGFSYEELVQVAKALTILYGAQNRMNIVTWIATETGHVTKEELRHIDSLFLHDLINC